MRRLTDGCGLVNLKLDVAHDLAPFGEFEIQFNVVTRARCASYPLPYSAFTPEARTTLPHFSIGDGDHLYVVHQVEQLAREMRQVAETGGAVVKLAGPFAR